MRAWTAEEEATLRRLWDEGASDEAIAEALGRSPRSVEGKRQRLGLTAWPSAVYSRKEDERIAELYGVGLTYDEIAAQLGRTPEAIGARIHRLGIRDRLDLDRRDWTPEEESALQDLWKLGKSDGEIAAELSRSAGSVLAKRWRLNMFHRQRTETRRRR